MAQVVERFVRDEEAASSSLVTPIIRKNLEKIEVLFFMPIECSHGVHSIIHDNRMLTWGAFYCIFLKSSKHSDAKSIRRNQRP